MSPYDCAKTGIHGAHETYELPFLSCVQVQTTRETHACLTVVNQTSIEAGQIFIVLKVVAQIIEIKLYRNCW